MPRVQPHCAAASALLSHGIGVKALRCASTAQRLRARGMVSASGWSSASKAQPRLVFSMPNSAAAAVFCTPGGKCSPLRKRTEREVSGV
jgi:hypothetical protein